MRHSLRTAITTACLIAAAALPMFAQAQVLPQTRVKAGIFLPQSASLRDATGDAWLKLGADMTLPLAAPFLGGDTRVGIDYAVNGGSSMIPLTVTQVWQPEGVVRSPLYLGVGGGLWILKGAGFDTTTRWGLRLVAGVDISERAFVEANYDFVERVSGVQFDGLSLMVGARF